MRVIFFTMFTSYLNAYTFYHFLGDTSKKWAFFSAQLPLKAYFYHIFPTYSIYFSLQEITPTTYVHQKCYFSSISIVNMHKSSVVILNWHNKKL